MNKKIVVLLIALVSTLILISPMAAAENNPVSGFALFEFNLFGDDSPDFEIENLKILKVNKKHTKSNGNVEKSKKYYLKFNVKSNSDSMGTYDVKIDCLSKKNKTIKTVKDSINSAGTYKIPLTKSSKIKAANLTVYNENGDVVLNQFTDHFKVTKKVTKDKAKKEKTSSSSSSGSDSGATYWASSNSNKFHYPSCEWAQKISSRNKVVFHSRDEAISSGYQPCQVCSP